MSDTTDEEISKLVPCSICGRTFRPDALERHQGICQKTSEKKRKVFDSKKQRTVVEDGTDRTVIAVPKRNEHKPKPKEDAKPKSNWREKHEDFIQTIRKTRQSDQDQAPEPKKIPSDYVQCPGCQRHFNQRAAERHIPWCQKKQQRNSKPQTSEDAREKLIARVKYRVPPPTKTRKPKTASSEPNNRRSRQHNEREQGSYSSPPTFGDNSRNQNRQRYGTERSEYRQRSKSKDSKLDALPDMYNQSIKFKEKFPNRSKRRGYVDLEESFSSEQLQELLRCSHLVDRCPKTVPGLRLIESTGRQNWSSGYNIKHGLEDSTLPEVSSSELPDSWMSKLVWNREMEASGSSSGSSSSGSLPPMSRESPTDVHAHFYCHQCHHRFPFVGAKYCCECGARRRVATISQTFILPYFISSTFTVIFNDTKFHKL